MLVVLKDLDRFRATRRASATHASFLGAATSSSSSEEEDTLGEGEEQGEWKVEEAADTAGGGREGYACVPNCDSDTQDLDRATPTGTGTQAGKSEASCGDAEEADDMDDRSENTLSEYEDCESISSSIRNLCGEWSLAVPRWWWCCCCWSG